MIGSPLGVAGIGLIGGSIALRARAAGVHVVGFDRDPESAARAVERGAVDELVLGLPELVRACRTLVIALPVNATASALEELAALPGPELIVDVASVKAPFEPYVARIAHYVPTHPMAGRERGGIAFADPALFNRATWAYVPVDDDALERRACRFIEVMGAMPLAIGAGRHDAIVALTSHLPQALSVVLGAQLASAADADGAVMDLCGPGMMSMLRLAHSPEAMWEPIVQANAEPLAARLRTLANALGSVADGLDGGDDGQLMSYFQLARRVAGTLQERMGPANRS